MKNKYNNKIEVSVRAIIFNHGKVLVCRLVKKNYYFFPGGHVEYNETLEQALRREMKEELGIRIKSYKLLGLVENIYTEDGINHHEINFVFLVNVKLKAIAKEKHINFDYLTIKQFNKVKVYPIKLQKEIIKHSVNNKFFWLKGS